MLTWRLSFWPLEASGAEGACFGNRRGVRQGHTTPGQARRLAPGSLDRNTAHRMAFTFYIFSRKGRCQYYHEWQRLKPVRQGAGSQEEDFKLMFGLFWSMRALATAIDPKK